ANPRRGRTNGLFLRELERLRRVERARRLVERIERVLDAAARQDRPVERRRQVESPGVTFAVLHEMVLIQARSAHSSRAACTYARERRPGAHGTSPLTNEWMSSPENDEEIWEFSAVTRRETPEPRSSPL